MLSHTSPATRWTCKLILFLMLGGCALFRENQGPPTSYAPREEIFYAKFDEVWRATQLALQRYPMRVNNMDLGVLETDILRGYQAWYPPYESGSPPEGFGYKLSIRVVKGQLDGRPAMKVSVLKESELQKDFFSAVQKQPSDGQEEISILYRIGRELQIEKALERAQNRLNRKR